MAQETAKDYLGHPCQFTQCKDHFSESFSDAQKLEFRQVKLQAAAVLLELKDRTEHTRNASRAICDLTHATDDEDQLCALMELLTAYEEDTSNLLYKFGGLVLAGFDVGPANVLGRA